MVVLNLEVFTKTEGRQIYLNLDLHESQLNQEKRLNFKRCFRQRAHSTDQTPFMRMFRSGTQ